MIDKEFLEVLKKDYKGYNGPCCKGDADEVFCGCKHYYIHLVDEYLDGIKLSFKNNPTSISFQGIVKAYEGIHDLGLEPIMFKMREISKSLNNLTGNIEK